MPIFCLTYTTIFREDKILMRKSLTFGLRVGQPVMQG